MNNLVLSLVNLKCLDKDLIVLSYCAQMILYHDGYNCEEGRYIYFLQSFPVSLTTLDQISIIRKLLQLAGTKEVNQRCKIIFRLQSNFIIRVFIAYLVIIFGKLLLLKRFAKQLWLKKYKLRSRRELKHWIRSERQSYV